LIIGIFSMLYVRERRLWVWLEPQVLGTPGPAQTHATMALSTNRKTLDGDHEFDHLTRKLLGNEAASV
jgi:cytochrome c biogenesis protein